MHPMILDELRRAPLISPSSAYLDAVLADSPSILWMLDETSGTTIVDYSGNGVDCEYMSGYTLGQAGIIDEHNTATDWTNGYGKCPSDTAALTNTGSMTLELCVVFDVIQDSTFFSSGDSATDSWWLWFSNGEKRLKLATRRNGTWPSAQFTFLPAVGTKYHLSLVYDKTTGNATLMLNGIKKNTVYNTLGIAGLDQAVSHNVMVASLLSTIYRSLDGRMAGLAFFKDTVLSDARRLAHYTATGI